MVKLNRNTRILLSGFLILLVFGIGFSLFDFGITGRQSEIDNIERNEQSNLDKNNEKLVHITNGKDASYISPEEHVKDGEGATARKDQKFKNLLNSYKDFIYLDEFMNRRGFGENLLIFYKYYPSDKKIDGPFRFLFDENGRINGENKLEEDSEIRKKVEEKINKLPDKLFSPSKDKNDRHIEFEHLGLKPSTEIPPDWKHVDVDSDVVFEFIRATKYVPPDWVHIERGEEAGYKERFYTGYRPPYWKHSKNKAKIGDAHIWNTHWVPPGWKHIDEGDDLPFDPLYPFGRGLFGKTGYVPPGWKHSKGDISAFPIIYYLDTFWVPNDWQHIDESNSNSDFEETGYVPPSYIHIKVGGGTGWGNYEYKSTAWVPRGFRHIDENEEGEGIEPPGKKRYGSDDYDHDFEHTGWVPPYFIHIKEEINNPQYGLNLKPTNWIKDHRGLEWKHVEGIVDDSGLKLKFTDWVPRDWIHIGKGDEYTNFEETGYVPPTWIKDGKKHVTKSFPGAQEPFTKTSRIPKEYQHITEYTLDITVPTMWAKDHIKETSVWEGPDGQVIILYATSALPPKSMFGGDPKHIENNQEAFERYGKNYPAFGRTAWVPPSWKHVDEDLIINPGGKKTEVFRKTAYLPPPQYGEPKI